MFIATGTLIIILLAVYLLGLVTVPLLFLFIVTSRGRIVARKAPASQHPN
jgi:hypothetical protein